MLFQKQKIKGLMLIKPEPFIDKRGLFRRIYCQKELKRNKINFNIKQINVSENKNIHTLRGFHYQKSPYGEEKIITCMKGEIHNIVIDMRKKSKTFMDWQSFNLSEVNRLALLVPKGCANAYLTLKKKHGFYIFTLSFLNLVLREVLGTMIQNLVLIGLIKQKSSLKKIILFNLYNENSYFW